MHDFECVECWYPIDWDDTFGWLHEDREDGQSFDHDAVAELPQMPDCDCSCHRVVRPGLVPCPRCEQDTGR